MSVLLVNPPRIIRKGNIWKKISRTLPRLGLACIASYLKEKGQEVSILDLQAEYMSQSRFQSRLKEINPDFIGISSTTVEIEGALNIAKLSKEVFGGVKVVLGGSHPSVMPDEVLSNPNVDFVVRGEGELTLYELVSGSPDILDIAGLSYKDGGAIKHNRPRPAIEDLDKMPLPAYDLLPMHKYRPSLGNYK